MGNQITKHTTTDEGLAQEVKTGKNTKEIEKRHRVINLKGMKAAVAQTSVPQSMT